MDYRQVQIPMLLLSGNSQVQAACILVLTADQTQQQ